MKKRILSALLAVSMMLTLLPTLALAADEAPAAPTGKPTVNANTELYQVEIMCEVDHAHYWTFPSTVGWAYSTPDQFKVGEPRLNDLDNGTAEQYPYICPVTSAYSLDECVAKVNAKDPGHWAVTTEEELPVAYYYWNAEEGWVLLRTKEANPQVRFAGTADDPKEGTLEIKISCAEQPGQPEQPEPDDSDKPTTKPAVGNNVLYQVEILCQKHVDGDPECKDHWWSHAETSAAFTVGDVQRNTTGYQQDTYEWVCPVTPSKALTSYLDSLNAKCAGHKLVSDELPTAWFFWNGTSWELIQEANTEVRFADNGVGSLTIYATCEGSEEPDPGPVDPDPPAGDRVWLTSMNIMGYDLFTKAPEKLPETADGRYLILAQSGVEGDTDVYALYLNPANISSGNAVADAGAGPCAVRLAMEDGQLVGYIPGMAETDPAAKVPLSKLLMTVSATEEGGLRISNGSLYLNMANKIAGDAADLTIQSRGSGTSAYLIQGGGRTLTLFVKDKNNTNAWHTDFWGPRADQGATSTSGSSYIYFLHTHVDDGRSVTAAGPDGTPIEADATGNFVIPAGGTIRVEGEITFTVPAMVESVTVAVNYASNLVMDSNGGFGVMGCVITMPDGSTTSQIARSGDAGAVAGTISFARTADNKVYFGGEGAMLDISAGNTETAPWLSSVADRTIRSVYIGEGITSVGNNAFKATSLSSVTLCEGLESIGDGAFESCRIESIDLPGTVQYIGEDAFKGCTHLRSITLPEGVASIGATAFANCPRLRTVTVQGVIGSIPTGAFQAISAHAPLNLVFEDELPANAYDDYAGMLPFVHQNGAILYANDKPSAALVGAAGSGDAYFADLNGGVLDVDALRPGVLPELPAKNGEAFIGWRVGDTNAALLGGSPVAKQPAGTVFTATWGGGLTVACTVTIDGTGYTVAKGETMGDRMPADPVREGYIFLGWTDANGDPFTANTVVGGNMVVKSEWEKIPTYFVTFVPNGGTLSSSAVVEVIQGGTVRIPSVAAPAGYTFSGWFTEDGVRFTASTAVTQDMTVTARWVETGSEPVVPPAPSTPSGPSGSTVVPVIPSDPGEEIEDPDTPLADLPFIDVGHEKWYAQSIANVVAKGLMEGTSALLFSPKDAMTRGMMAQALYALAEKPEVTDPASFLDLADGVSYADAVAWGVAKGLIYGYSDTQFGGEDALNRQQLATLLYRYAQTIDKLDVKADVSVLEQFPDQGRVSSWAKDAMAWAVAEELVIGRTDGTLDPRAAITRAEAAAILDRYAKRFLA